ncbi:MAG: hypothetical protein V3V14_13750 [Saprospiraceae bacterium]
MKHRIARDVLWKGVIEDCAHDFIQYFFENYCEQVDRNISIDFLDKELAEITNQSDEKNRRADKLLKVFFKDGTEKWFLIHIEVQGQPDKQFSRRMFTYYYRILDKYNIDTTAICIFTYKSMSGHPKTYSHSFFGTKILYQYNTYSLFDEYNPTYQKNNLFHIIMTAAYHQKDKITDQQLFKTKIDLVRSIIASGVEMKYFRSLMNFVKNYKRFDNIENALIFENKTLELTNNKYNMGIEEAILDYVRTEGHTEGIEQGIEQGIEKIILQAYAKGHSPEDIANFNAIPLNKVIDVINDNR